LVQIKLKKKKHRKMKQTTGHDTKRKRKEGWVLACEKKAGAEL
jgi:hypothetical protein